MPGIAFTVPGTPIPKQSTRFDGHGHAHTDPRVKAWQETVTLAAVTAVAQVAGFEPYTGSLEVWLWFTLPTRRRVDLDNLSKAVLDGCNGVLWRDDSQVCELHIRKAYQPDAPGVAVRVYQKGGEND